MKTEELREFSKKFRVSGAKIGLVEDFDGGGGGVEGEGTGGGFSFGDVGGESWEM